MANKKVKIKVFEGGRKPESKNGNWYDCYVRTANVNGLTPSGNVIRFAPGDIVVVHLGFAMDIGKGYGISNLKRMRQFYYIIEKGVALPHQLSWSHILSLLPIDDINEINYYIDISIKQNLSYRELRNKIKTNEYE